MSALPNTHRGALRQNSRRRTRPIAPVARSSAKRLANSEVLHDPLQASDRLMWWGWAVAISFVLAGLLWHLLTYQSSRSEVKTADAQQDLIQSTLLER